jgi:hypothetical protein
MSLKEYYRYAERRSKTVENCAVHHIINQHIAPVEARQYLDIHRNAPVDFPVCENCTYSLRKIIAAEDAATQARKAKIKT